MKFSPNMTLDEFVKLTEQFADERYGTSITAENSDQFIYSSDSLLAEAEERKERMLANKLRAENTGYDLTEATMDNIKQQVHRAGGLKVGKFQIRIRNYRQDKEGTKVDMDIYEDKIHVNNFGHRNKMPNKINVLKDMRFEGRPWLSYFKNSVLGGKDIPIDAAAIIVRWVQALNRMQAFA